MARSKASVDKTLRCAVKFWSIDKTGHTPTLLQGVRHVVRKQGFSSAQINRALKDAARSGDVVLGGARSGKTIKLTGSVACANVKLAPWTNDGYPGASLDGSRRRRRK